jgi:hypothetical protein
MPSQNRVRITKVHLEPSKPSIQRRTEGGHEEKGLVAGASGLIGVAAAEAFLSAARDVVAISRRRPRLPSGRDFEFIPVDLCVTRVPSVRRCSRDDITHVAYAAIYIFNFTNGDVFEWRSVWPALAETHGVKLAPDEPASLAAYLRDNAEPWSKIVAKYGLVSSDLRAFVGQGDQHADFAFAYGRPRGLCQHRQASQSRLQRRRRHSRCVLRRPPVIHRSKVFTAAATGIARGVILSGNPSVPVPSKAPPHGDTLIRCPKERP